jgi:anaerobic magnesium-protoporphyrin IX monomethyl ester cyclase
MEENLENSDGSILFINPCLRLNAKRKFPPVGLACILSAVQKANIKFDLIDMDVHNMSLEQLNELIQRKPYNIFALGCIVTALSLVKQISKLIREINPNAIIITGNSVATSIPELLLENTEADIAVLGEGDVTTVELLKQILNGNSLDSVKGIAYKKNGAIIKTQQRELIENLDSVGFPNWDLFELELYNRDMVKPATDDSEVSIVYPLNAARGCPFQCTFCYHVFKGQRYRKYSEDSVIEEIRRLHDKYKATFIYFWDELTFPNIKSVERMVEKMEELPFRIGWEGITRGDLFSEKDIPLIIRMREAGCKSIAFSIENASPEILKAMNKKINIARIVEHCNALRKGGVTALTSIIFGYPQETLDSIKATLDLCGKCNIFPSVGFLQPLPGTPIYEWAVGNNYIQNELSYLLQAGDRQDFHVNLTKIPTKDFIEFVTVELNKLAEKMGLKFENPLKTTVYQKPKN